MEREALLQEVNSLIEEDGKQLSRSISEETINAELDDELGNICDDEEENKKVYRRIANRLLRIDGNIHANVSREVKEYKKKAKNPVKSTNTGEGDEEKPNPHDADTPEWAKALTRRIDAIEQARKDRDDAAAKEATIDKVRKDLRSKFKDSNVEVNEYIYRQTFRDLELPELEDGERPDTDELVRQMEKAYYKNLKEAGLDKKDTGKSHFGGRGGEKGESAADRFFARKGKKEGWKK